MAAGPIVVGYDGSPDAQRASRWALEEAAATALPVRLSYGFEWLATSGWLGPGLGPASWSDQEARDRVEQLLRDVVEQARANYPEVTVDTEVLDGPPTVRLLERSAGASLVVLGNRGHGGFAGLLTGSTTVALAAHAHCPVVVVRGDDHPRPGRVLVGVDGSDCSLRALDFAFNRAATRGVPLWVVRAWTGPDGHRPSGEIDPDAITSGETIALERLLGDWQVRFPEVPVSSEVVAGSPAETLIERSRDAQLVVVGSRGHGGFRGLLLGSVSQQLLHHSHRPVAVVRELAAGGQTGPEPG